MKEALSQRWQNPPLDTVVTWIQLISYRPIFVTSVCITSSYAWLCHFFSRIFSSKKEETTEGWNKYIIGSFIVCR